MMLGLSLAICGTPACVPAGPDQPATMLDRADGGDSGQSMSSDSGPMDQGIVLDAGTPDVGLADSGPQDMGFVDTGAPDAAPQMDAGMPDTGVRPDAGPVADAGTVPVSGQRAETAFGTRHIYSQLQAWTYDGVYFLAVDVVTGEGVVYHAGTWQEVARVQHGGHRWITGTHEVLAFEEGLGGGAELYGYDLDTGVDRRIMSLGHPGLQSGRSQEETDRDGRWVAIYIDNATSGGARIMTADLWNGTVGADVSVSSIGCNFEPDWVGVDPTGQFLLVQAVPDGTGPCRGLWTHNMQTGAPIQQITTHHNHGTMGLGPTGRPYFLSTEGTHPNDNNQPGIFRYWLDTGLNEVVGTPMPWGAIDHASCLDGPGTACMLSASNEFSTEYTGQIWRLDFGGQRTVIEPHNAAGCGYWGQAQVTVGPGGRFAYATHGGNCNRIRSMIVQ